MSASVSQCANGWQIWSKYRLLAGFAALFAAAHFYVTEKNLPGGTEDTDSPAEDREDRARQRPGRVCGTEKTDTA